MRIRSIRPEFWTSEDMGQLSRDARLLYIGIWSYVDDNGVGRDVEQLIAADLFPFDLSRDARETLAMVSEGLGALCEGGQIIRYQVAGKPYLFVQAWDGNQRVDKPGKARYPRPTCEDAEIRETLASLSRESPDTLVPGEGEKGRRGEEKPSSELRPDVRQLLDHLDARIEATGEKKPTRTDRNLTAGRLLLDSDNRPHAEAMRLIEFATQDEFWRSNIRSMSKFREKYPQLRDKAVRLGWLNQTGNLRSLPGGPRRDVDANGEHIPEAWR